MALVAAVLLGGAWAVDRALGENGVERTDRKLAAALRASTAALGMRVERAGVEAERLARSPTVQRALAARDRQRLAAIARSEPQPVLLRVSGSFAIGEPVADAVRRSAASRLGEATVFVPLDDDLLDSIERSSDSAEGIRLVLVRSGHVLAGPTSLHSEPIALPGASGGDTKAGGKRYRAASVPVLRTSRPTELGALLPRSLVDSSGGRRRRILYAVLATLATLALVAALFAEIAPRRRRDRRRGPGRRSMPIRGNDSRDALAFVGEALAATHDPEALLPVILGVAIEATGAVGGRLVEGTQELAVRGRAGVGDPLVLPLGGNGNESRLYLYPPTDGFSDESRELARWLATQASIALENARLHGLVKAQAVTDELTGLANRRRFMEVLTLELKRAERFESPLALLLADLDDFKLVNDRFGHHTGDEALRALSGVFRAGLRDVDLAARLGGEEFAVLLPETDEAGAAGVAERLRTGLEALDIEGPAGASLSVTASFGVAVYPEVRTSDELLTTADAALYRAKADGKNRVALAHATR